MPLFSSLDPSIARRVRIWLDGPYDEKSKEEIHTLLKTDPAALTDAFYTDLSFGTAGLRGIMGVGSNRMNIYTVRRATLGLANYLHKKGELPLSVLIGFDSRNNSLEFARETARVLAAQNIHVYLLKELRPVPYISFACRFKRCTAAVMITASHNPAEYNGYKVYWSDGAQIVSPHDEGIMQEVEAISASQSIEVSNLEDPRIEILDEHLDNDYLAAIRSHALTADQDHREGKTLKIAYTSLHGTGITLAPKALTDWGFKNLHFVQQQIVPDGAFPTVKFPNPEYEEALQLGIETLVHTQADILLATDPDADRIGVVVRHALKPIPLNGNETAAICLYFLCEMLSKQGKMPANGAFVTTIVTTELLKTIAAAYHRPCFEVLTGFKYIGEKIRQWETSSNGYTFLFGAEESYGSLLGTHARDKDAIIAACLIAEIALYTKQEGKTLIDYLHEIYYKFGVFREKQLALTFSPGKIGMQEISSYMQQLRKNPPQEIGGISVASLQDVEKGVADLPKADVLIFRLADQSKLIVRPSGTEPKLKIYGSVHKKHFHSLQEAIADCDLLLDQLITGLKNALHPSARNRS